MPTFDISLPDSMQEFIGKQVEHRGYSSVSDYMRDLVRADQKRIAKEELEQMMLESLHSGDTLAVNADDGNDLKQNFREHSKLRSA